MTSATSIDDARLRDMRVLETLEKSISEPADGEAAETLQGKFLFPKNTRVIL